MKKYKFTIKGTEYDVEVKNYENNIMDIDVNGTEYQVEVHKEQKVTKTPTIIRTDKPKIEAPAEKIVVETHDTIAPLPGNILKIEVKEGDTVKKGDVLLVMEAMKMENNVMSEIDGTIHSLKVKVGDIVLQGDVLIEVSK